jgi:hypothetical protein
MAVATIRAARAALISQIHSGPNRDDLADAYLKAEIIEYRNRPWLDNESVRAKGRLHISPDPSP